MEQFFRDLKFGLRQLLRQPVITLISAVALGLGIGSVTTQLSVTKAIFLSGLDFEDSSEIAHIERTNVKRTNFPTEIPVQELPFLRESQTVFEGLAGFYNGTANLTLQGNVKRYDGCFISANAFELLRVKAYLGRGLQPSDDQPEAPEVIVLSYTVWQNDFAGDPDIVGQQGILNGRPVTIVGIMPEKFKFPLNEQMWIPLFKQQDISGLAYGDTAITLEVFGRLKDDATYDKAEASMSLIARRMAEEHPETHAGYSGIHVKPFTEEYMGNQTVPLAFAMLMITILILIIACANVANLLIARSLRRQKEIAIRSALGATRTRIIYQFLTESILLSSLGALLGIILALSNIEGIKDMTVQMNTPFWMDFNFDGKVFIGVAVLTLLTGIVSGLVPAVRASRINENEVLKDDTRTGTSLQMGIFGRILVIVQISVAAVILTLVVLFVQSTNNALELDYAYDPDAVMTARIALFEEAYPDAKARANFIAAYLKRLQARPEVEVAAATSRYQFMGGGGVLYDLPNAPSQNDSERKFVRMQRVSPDFFEAMQLPLISGRHFRAEDFAAPFPQYAIVNRDFADREWKHTNPIGQRFRPDIAAGEVIPFDELPWIEVIGVVGGLQESLFFDDNDYDGAGFIIPQTVESTPRFITIMARGSGDPQNLIPIMREEIAAMDRNLPLYQQGTPRQINDQTNVQLSFFSSIFTRFGILATFLAAVGIYGVITFSVQQRIMEFGIRQALGATRADIFKLVYLHALKQLLYGFIIAVLLLSPLILSPGLREWMAIFFYETDPDSLVPYLFSFGFVATIAIFSAAPPALRASRIHPAQALRHE